MKKREAHIQRKTKETDIDLALNLDGEGNAAVSTGIGFLDHMLISLTRHSGFDLKLTCKGDLDIDDHHTAEDCAIVLGTALDQALDTRSGIRRFGATMAPLDEALARAVVDLSGRPFADVNLMIGTGHIGALRAENLTHVIQSLAMASKSTVHVDVIKGDNDHHKAEAAFKALALALKQAVSPDGTDRVPSTKEVLG